MQRLWDPVDCEIFTRKAQNRIGREGCPCCPCSCHHPHSPCCQNRHPFLSLFTFLSFSSFYYYYITFPLSLFTCTYFFLKIADTDELQEQKEEKKEKKLTVEERIAKANETLRQCFSQLPNYDLLINRLVTYGIDALPQHCSLTPGTFIFIQILYLIVLLIAG